MTDFKNYYGTYMGFEYIGKGTSKAGKDWVHYKLNVVHGDDKKPSFHYWNDPKDLVVGDKYHLLFVEDKYDHPEHGEVISKKVIKIDKTDKDLDGFQESIEKPSETPSLAPQTQQNELKVPEVPSDNNASKTPKTQPVASSVAMANNSLPSTDDNTFCEKYRTDVEITDWSVQDFVIRYMIHTTPAIKDEFKRLKGLYNEKVNPNTDKKVEGI